MRDNFHNWQEHLKKQWDKKCGRRHRGSEEVILAVDEREPCFAPQPRAPPTCRSTAEPQKYIIKTPPRPVQMQIANTMMTENIVLRQTPNSLVNTLPVPCLRNCKKTVAHSASRKAAKTQSRKYKQQMSYKYKNKCWTKEKHVLWDCANVWTIAKILHCAAFKKIQTEI